MKKKNYQSSWKIILFSEEQKKEKNKGNANTIEKKLCIEMKVKLNL